MKLNQLTDDQLVQAYRNARKRKEDADAAHNEAQRPLKDAMSALEGEALRRMNERETTSFKGAHGTAFVNNSVSVSVKDSSAFFDWLTETGKWECADIRAGKKEIQNFAENTGGDLPPGVNMTQQRVVRFRAPSNK